MKTGKKRKSLVKKAEEEIVNDIYGESVTGKLNYTRLTQKKIRKKRQKKLTQKKVEKYTINIIRVCSRLRKKALVS